MRVESKEYCLMISSRDVPHNVLQACAVACGIVMANYYPSELMPVAIKDNDNILTFIVKDENGMGLMLNNGPMYYSERFIENTISYKDYDRLCDNMADLKEGDTIEAVIVYYDNNIRGLDETDTLFIFGMK